MERFPHSLMVLVIDCDGNYPARLHHIRQGISATLADRVCIIGALNEPRDLKRIAGDGYEDIGRQLALNCADGQTEAWNENEQLRHNVSELARLRDRVWSILFS